jgi:hypothetical protein
MPRERSMLRARLHGIHVTVQHLVNGGSYNSPTGCAEIELGQAILRLCRSLQLLWDNKNVHLLADNFEVIKSRMNVKRQATCAFQNAEHP